MPKDGNRGCVRVNRRFFFYSLQLIPPLTCILTQTYGCFVANRPLTFNSIRVLFTVQEVGASGGTDPPPDTIAFRLLAGQGHDHHRRPLAAWEVVRGGPESGKLLRRAAMPDRRLIKGQVVRRRSNDL